MKNASCFVFFCPMQNKKCYNFSKWKVVQPPTHSPGSPYTNHGTLHFRRVILDFPLATLGVHALKLPLSHDRF